MSDDEVVASYVAPRYLFKCEKSSNVIENNDTMSDDEVVASYVPPRYLLSSKSSKSTIFVYRK